MTRINVVPISELHPKHLMAEWRELPRVFTYVRGLVHQNKHVRDVTIPSEYCLGEGHVKFFTNKLRYLAKRHYTITAELLVRQYQLTLVAPLATVYGDIPIEWWYDYHPTDTALALNRQRLRERMPDFYGL